MNMTEQLKEYVKADLVEQRGTWYYYNNEKLGQRNEAESKLSELIDQGKIETPVASDNVKGQQPETLPPSMKVAEVKGEGDVVAELLPVIKLPRINPALANPQELPEQTHDIFKKLTAHVGDIEQYKSGGRFRVFVFGVDCRIEKNPLVQSCPYVFRHCDKKRNVSNGTSTTNKGWTVFPKSLNEVDPRTGNKWLTVARDDSPDEDYYTAGDTILCYAKKNQFRNKKGKMAMENMLKSGAIADSRQETAEKMAKMSSTNPEQSMQGYMAANKRDQTVAHEQLEKNTNFSSQQAQKYVDDINSLGDGETDIAVEVDNMRKLVDAGKVGKTMKSAKPLSIDDL